MYILANLTCCSNDVSLTIPFVAVEAREHRGAARLMGFLAFERSGSRAASLSMPAACLDARSASKRKMVSLNCSRSVEVWCSLTERFTGNKTCARSKGGACR